MIRLLAAALALLLCCSRRAARARRGPAPADRRAHLAGGSGAFAGKAYLEAVRFAVTEANARGNGPRFD